MAKSLFTGHSKHLATASTKPLQKARSRRAVLLFVALVISCNPFSDAGAALVMMQLPVCDHCLQLHCSALCMHTAMQYSCYKFKMQCYKFWMSVGALSTVVDKRGCKFSRYAIAYTAMQSPQQCKVPMGLLNEEFKRYESTRTHFNK